MGLELDGVIYVMADLLPESAYSRDAHDICKERRGGGLLQSMQIILSPSRGESVPVGYRKIMAF